MSMPRMLAREIHYLIDRMKFHGEPGPTVETLEAWLTYLKQAGFAPDFGPYRVLSLIPREAPKEGQD